MDKEIKINFFGDSICFGQGVSIIHGWVPRIAGELNRIFNEKKFSINMQDAFLENLKLDQRTLAKQ